MGRHSRKRSANLSQGVDQHGERDGPDSAEQRSLSEQRVISIGGASGAHQNIVGSADHGVSEHQRDVRRVAKRLRVSRGATHPLARTFDAFDLDVIFNAPDVLEHITQAGFERIATANLLADPRNVGLVIEGGAFMFAQLEPGIYEANASFLSEYRGAYAKAAIREAASWMFCRTDAVTLFARIPQCNARALIAAKWTGAGYVGTRPGAWPKKDGVTYGASIYQLLIDDFFKAANLIERGLDMLAHLESARWRLAGETDDLISAMITPSLARHVGFAFAMIFAGQIDKGILWYNHYAKMALWPPMGLISREPYLIVAFGVLAQISGDSLVPIKCVI